MSRMKKPGKKAGKRRPPSLRRRYTIGFTLIIFLCFNLLGASLVGFTAHYRYRKTVEQLSHQTENVAQTTSELIRGGHLSIYGSSDNSTAMLCSTLDLISNTLEADVYICDTYGNLYMCRDLIRNGQIAEDGYCPVHTNLNLPENSLNAVINGSYAGGTNKIGANREYQFLVGEPITVHGRTVLMVIASASVRSSLLAYLAPIVGMFFIAEAIALVIAALTVYRSVRSLTAPLVSLSNAAHSYARGDFSPRVNIDRNDEIGQLAGAFNQMAADLERLESSRRSFVANVSHELKPPMTTSGGFIDGMLDGTIPPDRHRDYLTIVSAEVRRLSRMVVSMLNLSKIEAGQLDLKFAPVDIRALLIETTLSFEKQIEQKHLDIRGFDIMLPHLIRADRDLMSQVVYNLIDNAVKFTPDDGSITFSASVTENDRVEVKILNSGVGIPSAEKARIFERFYKVDKSRSYDKKSSGLGLYIVKSILDLHGGSIRVESAVGQYTEFIFEVPKDSADN